MYNCYRECNNRQWSENGFQWPENVETRWNYENRYFILGYWYETEYILRIAGNVQCKADEWFWCDPGRWDLYVFPITLTKNYQFKKSKGIPRQTEVALGVPARLRPRIFSTFGTTRAVDRQPNAPAAFTPGEIPGTHFQKLNWPQGTWFCRKEPRKKSQVTRPWMDPGTLRLVAQLLNHYATPGPHYQFRMHNIPEEQRFQVIWMLQTLITHRLDHVWS